MSEQVTSGREGARVPGPELVVVVDAEQAVAHDGRGPGRGRQRRRLRPHRRWRRQDRCHGCCRSRGRPITPLFPQAFADRASGSVSSAPASPQDPALGSDPCSRRRPRPGGLLPRRRSRGRAGGAGRAAARHRRGGWRLRPRPGRGPLRPPRPQRVRAWLRPAARGHPRRQPAPAPHRRPGALTGGPGPPHAGLHRASGVPGRCTRRGRRQVRVDGRRWPGLGPADHRLRERVPDGPRGPAREQRRGGQRDRRRPRARHRRPRGHRG
jgi:hypothetical protein